MERKRLYSIAFAAALVTAALLPMSAATANPTLTCGSVITTDTTLPYDLVNCPGDGLVIAADGVTLDLNGHAVSGDRVANTETDFGDVGIRVEGHDHATVTGGSVAGFDHGILFDGSSYAAVTSVAVHNNRRRGVMFVNASDYARVAGVAAAHNGTPEGGSGVRFVSSSHGQVAASRFTDNHVAMSTAEGADGNTFTGNTVSGGGFEINFSRGTTISHNIISHSGVSLESSDDSTITDNVVKQLTGPDGIGIQIYGNNNLVADNTVVGAVRYGIEVDDFQDEGHSPAVGNVVRDNAVHGAEEEGIAIGPEAGGVVLNTIVEHNLVDNAGDDGIQVVGPSTGLQTTTLTGNTAVHNGDLGIEALPGVIDGGGNRAHANGNPVQCVGVSCD